LVRLTPDTTTATRGVRLEPDLPTDTPLITLENLDRDMTRPGQIVRQTIGPFDRQDTALKFLEPEVVSRGLFKTIEIGVIKREPTPSVFMHQCERRAADVFRIYAEALRQPPHERRLPGAEISGEENDISRRQRCREFSGDSRSLYL
jgi:hypothetical protein